MKRIFIIALVVLAAAMGFPGKSQAGYCVVSDEGTSTTDTDTLPGVINKTVNQGMSNNCTMRYYDSTYSDTSCGGSTSKYHCTNDYQHFTYGILFKTSVIGGSVDKITLTSKVTIDSYAGIVIGNPSLDTLIDSTNEIAEAKNAVDGYTTDSFLVDAGIMDASQNYKFYGYNETFLETYFTADWDGSTLKDYGSIVLDVSGVSGSKPFVCRDADSANVFLRHIVLITNGYDYEDIFNGECIKNGGDVQVCPSTDWNGSLPSEDSEWCGKSTPGLGSWVTPGVGSGIYPGLGSGIGSGDDDCTDVWYQDSDADSYGNASVSTTACDQPSGYVANADDCDDTNSLAYPDAAEDCSDGTVDLNCNDSTGCYDDACVSDNTCNGVGIESACSDDSDNDGDGYTDCDDSDCAADTTCYTAGGTTGGGTTTTTPTITADTTETACSDSTDNDSDGTVDCDDSDCAADATCTADTDGDTYSAADGDCDDSNGDINPGEDEICASLVDENCDGVIDETASCVDPSTSTVAAEGSGGGCGCDLNAKAAPVWYDAILAMIAMVPLLTAMLLRAKAARAE